MPFTCKSCSSSPAQRCHGSWEPDKPPTHRAAAEVKVPGGMMEMRTEGVLKLFFPSFKALRFQTSFLFAQYKQTALAFPAKPPVTQPLAGHQCPCPPPPPLRLSTTRTPFTITGCFGAGVCNPPPGASPASAAKPSFTGDGSWGLPRLCTPRPPPSRHLGVLS